ncbi:MAG: hypothetical protein R3C11_11355 [Planctomycetaceae bacterium]
MESDEEDRFGIPIVNDSNVVRFLSEMRRYQKQQSELESEFYELLELTGSWWDVAHLIPIAFIDFDRKHLAACYGDGLGIQYYVPAGWTGEFENFCIEYPPTLLPDSLKFWFKDGVNMLSNLKD